MMGWGTGGGVVFGVKGMEKGRLLSASCRVCVGERREGKEGRRTEKTQKEKEIKICPATKRRWSVCISHLYFVTYMVYGVWNLAVFPSTPLSSVCRASRSITLQATPTVNRRIPPTPFLVTRIIKIPKIPPTRAHGQKLQRATPTPTVTVESSSSIDPMPPPPKKNSERALDFDAHGPRAQVITRRLEAGVLPPAVGDPVDLEVQLQGHGVLVVVRLCF